MNVPNDPNESVQHLLKEFSTRPGVMGSYLVRRNGVCIASEGSPRVPPELVCAMGSVAFGAAETVFGELSRHPTIRLQAETQAYKMIIASATPELLLVVLAMPELSWDECLDVCSKLLNELTQVVAS